jgi:glycogen operon protein
LKANGADVAVCSKHGTKVFMCVFESTGEHRFELTKRDGDVHHDFIENVKEGARYGFRVEGPWAPELGLRFDASKLLVDPYAWSLDQPFIYHNELSESGRDTAHLVPKCVVQPALPDVQRAPYRKPGFIYELPVSAFTMLHPDVPQARRGTVAALAEPPVIAHLKNIGVDTIELMPITAWIDERHHKPLGLHNAWGYNPIQFFAPDPKLAPGGLVEIRETIAELHRHGFRVILDIVLNHTGESDQFGPTLCFRGLDNPLYYAHARGELINDTGCGNTVALNEPHIVEMVVSALRHWVLKAGIDGFRFDLATVMGRMADGFHADAPLLKAIENDDVLSTCIMIAEPWDIGPGGYQLGKFPARWHEWNDKFRDDVRRFWRGDDFSANAVATRISGSSDVFSKPSRSINFISAHDGFTLRDLVTYSEKHNFANGEQNRDGKSGEVTWVGGDECTLLATLFLSRGIPMLTAGDEFGRTQDGNNNAYAQANEITWLDWRKKNEDLISQVKWLVELRSRFSYFKEDRFLVQESSDETDATIAYWFDQNGNALDWSTTTQRYVGLLLTERDQRMALVFNGSTSAKAFPIAAAGSEGWRNFKPPPHADLQKPFCVEFYLEIDECHQDDLC